MDAILITDRPRIVALKREPAHEVFNAPTTN